jgi:hypothetical protein
MKILLLLLTTGYSFCQVGIGTTSPTSSLDVNGDLRVRNFTKGTVESMQNGTTYSTPYRVIGLAVIMKNGAISKGFGLSCVRLNNNLYRLTFVTAEIDNDYIIMLSSRGRNTYYDNTNINSFDVVIDGNSNTPVNFDFNVTVYRIE